jgi:hypothetical protein
VLTEKSFEYEIYVNYCRYTVEEGGKRKRYRQLLTQSENHEGQGR